MRYLKYLKSILILCGLLILFGCAIAVADKNKRALTMLKVGDTQLTLVKLLGRPEKVYAFGNRKYWLYKTDTELNYDEYDLNTPVLLIDEVVVGWGKQYFKDIGISPTIKNYSNPSPIIFSSPSYIPPLPTNVPVYPRQNPYLNTPQQNLQNPTVNCTQNGAGGYRCQ